jgi:HK97 family phage prohead protease
MDLTKDFQSEIKDLDSTLGYVKAYANAYNNEDSDSDISAPGSFSKTVSENIKKLRVYKNHDTRLLVGVPKAIDANDSYGLMTETQFQMNTDLGKDMFNDVKLITDNNQDADLSIGYRVIRRDQKDRRIITEYALKEYSFLTSWGANPLATVQGLKGVDSVSKIIDHLTKMYNLPYSDARLAQVENILKSLAIAPLFDDTQKAEPTFSFNSFSKI